MTRLPIIGVSACVKPVSGCDVMFHAAPEPYLTAVVEAAHGLPLVVPALGEALEPDQIVHVLDGLLLTGSKSNVLPKFYGKPGSRPGTLHDQPRDSTTLPLIRAAIARGIPVLAICRGLQEVNVALGGTLFQHVHEEPDKMDHRADESRSVEEQYGPSHSVALTPGGLLARLAGTKTVTVNSLHGQGIDRLAPGIVVEASAPDGLIEAIRLDMGPGFLVAVQWHPEWNWRQDKLSAALFTAFGEAAQSYAFRS
ncbi:MAG: gamma-glutamyl-gamma-aminobutyrate hydrolase family protein [Alphaproteobacteria bacterium]|nr:gamma-glutamyl-gamma-aminobutyrate hydrolase family protein [Alphaproteobacteria bacterium]